MKRNDFFKSLLSLPLISFFWKGKAKAETITVPGTCRVVGKDLLYEPKIGSGADEGLYEDRHYMNDCPSDYVPFYPFKIEDCDHSMWFLDKHNPDPKQKGMRCMNCGWQPNAYELFRTVNDPPKEPKQNGIYTVTTGTWNKPTDP